MADTEPDLNEKTVFLIVSESEYVNEGLFRCYQNSVRGMKGNHDSVPSLLFVRSGFTLLLKVYL